MLAGIGFGMKALEPNEPTMLIRTCIGVGIAGSSSARNRPAVGDPVLCEFTVDGEDGKWPPLQPQEPVTQAITSVGNASLMRISIARARSVPTANHRHAYNFMAPEFTAATITHGS